MVFHQKYIFSIFKRFMLIFLNKHNEWQKKSFFEPDFRYHFYTHHRQFSHCLNMDLMLLKSAVFVNENYFHEGYDQADEAKGLTNTNSLDTVRQIGCLPQN